MKRLLEIARWLRRHGDIDQIRYVINAKTGKTAAKRAMGY